MMELAGAGGGCEQSWRRHEEWQDSVLKVSPKGGTRKSGLGGKIEGVFSTELDS